MKVSIKDFCGQLTVSKNGKDIPVHLIRCFPWSDPDKYYSLRDSKGNEVFLIEELRDLDSLSQKAIMAELADARFILEITKVDVIEKEFELRNWIVETKQGRRTFQTGLEEWPTLLPSRGILIKDIVGDLYHIVDYSLLDKKSRELLKGFVG